MRKPSKLCLYYGNPRTAKNISKLFPRDPESNSAREALGRKGKGEGGKEALGANGKIGQAEAASGGLKKGMGGERLGTKVKNEKKESGRCSGPKGKRARGRGFDDNGKRHGRRLQGERKKGPGVGTALQVERKRRSEPLMPAGVRACLLLPRNTHEDAAERSGMITPSNRPNSQSPNVVRCGT